nr:restriction endonuclease subunit S [Dyella lutea]
MPRYPEYKDSGVPWLGEIPAHWLIAPVKQLGKLKGGAGFPHAEQGLDAEELPFHKVNALGRAGSDGVLWGSENNISRATAERLGAYIFPSGALVFAKVGAALLLGRIRRLGEAACIDNNMMGLVVDDDAADVAFVSYALNLVRFDLIANPGAVPSLNEGQIGNFQLVLPNRAEQRAIATFLDRETAKIDALIAEQEKLLALLAEKRQATISHAVTRGLNPNAPMKDSGIPWLGEVPAHWEVGPLKRFWSVTDCKHLTAEFTEDGIPLASIREVQSRFVDLSDAKRTTEGFFEQLIEGGRDPRAGDLLFSRNATVGEVAQVPSSVEKFAMGQDVCLLRRLGGAASPDYMQCVLRSPVVSEQLNALMIGSTFKRINVEQIRSLAVPFPPPGEQLEISSCLENLLGSYESLAQGAVAAVALLKERRSALISAAVTGKIDVRNAA